MGIYIKGLDWPELGMPITITIFNDGAVNEEGIADYQAIEIKTPHGRLIDADREIKTITEIIESNSLTEMGWNQYDFCRRTLKTAPTVIEAEVE